jgi:hypothetical protein
MATALADELIARNPCVVKGAGQEHLLERLTPLVAEVDALADAMPDTLRAASFCPPGANYIVVNSSASNSGTSISCTEP